MDRRDFLKKVAQLVGTSAAGISLTKLQIATIATGLTGAAGCARNPVGEDPLNRKGNALLAPCANIHACDNQVYNCDSQEYICVDQTFLCQAPTKFMCNNDKFTCSLSFECQTGEPFECEAPAFSIVHQGSTSIG